MTFDKMWHLMQKHPLLRKTSETEVYREFSDNKAEMVTLGSHPRGIFYLCRAWGPRGRWVTTGFVVEWLPTGRMFGQRMTYGSYDYPLPFECAYPIYEKICQGRTPPPAPLSPEEQSANLKRDLILWLLRPLMWVVGYA